MNAIVKAPPQAKASILDRQKLEQRLDWLRRDVRTLDKLWKPASGKRDDAKYLAAREQWMAFGSGCAVEQTSELYQLCDNPRYWPDDVEAPCAIEIGKALGSLVGSFPTSNVPNPDIYTTALLDDVIGLGMYHWHALEAGCRRIRQTKTFMPAIAEVLTVLREEEEKWDARHEALMGGRFHAFCALGDLAEESKQLEQSAQPICEPIVVTVEEDEF